jgi:hypothetical protein
MTQQSYYLPQMPNIGFARGGRVGAASGLSRMLDQLGSRRA